MADFTAPRCPVPSRGSDERIVLGHGGGGRLMQRLIERTIASALPHVDTRVDAAVVDTKTTRLAVTTDAFVVDPLFFPGGDIGSLAVNGTVNDLAMVGATPTHLTSALILEEGLRIADLERIVHSMAAAAHAANVQIVAGDTKVVGRGHGDGVFITTTGVGRAPERPIGPAQVRGGDVVIASGDVGRHGIAILSRREGLAFAVEIESDCAPLVAPITALARAGVEVHALRDATRGGLAAALVEVAHAARLALEIDEAAVPVARPVRAACELLGLDPWGVANEGRFVAFVAERDSDRALAVLQQVEVSCGARAIGRVVRTSVPAIVVARTPLGTTRTVDLPSGEQLPRIC